MTFADYIEQLRKLPEDPSFEPEIDDIDAEKDRQLRELDDLQSGAIRKGIVEAGEGEDSPADGDLVFFHLSIKTEDGRVLQTTRLEEEGSGVPCAFIIGKGWRAPRGWELALLEMKRRERAVLKLQPAYGFAHKDCKVKPPEGHAPDEAYVFDIQLVNWYPKNGVRAVGEEGQLIKHVVQEAESWENPRPPFQVTVAVTARVPSSTGREGEGLPYFQTRQQEDGAGAEQRGSKAGPPLTWVMGEGRVPRGLEEAVGSLARGERSFVSCPAELASGGDLMPAPPAGVERVEFELELLSMLQVRDMTGDGEVTKRRVKEGIGEFPLDCPLEDSAVKVHFKCYSPDTGKVYVDTRGPDGASPPLEFDTGMGAVPEAIDMSVRLMTPQEVSIIRSTGRYAFDGRDDQPPEWQEGETVEFELELVSFEKQPNWYHMAAGEKIAQAELLKEQGNKVFKRGLYKFAKQKYTKALKLLEQTFDIEPGDEADSYSKLKAACFVNLALLAQKEHDLTDSFKWCEKALREVVDHPKALYRRAIAHAMLGNYEEAEQDFLRTKEVNPSSAAEIDRELARMKHQRKLAEAKQKREFTNFFARKDAKESA